MVVRRQHFSGDRRRRLHDEPPDLAPQLGEHAGAIAFGRLVRPDEDLFGGGDGLPRLLGLDARRRGAGFLDQLLARPRRPWPGSSWRSASIRASSALIFSALARPSAICCAPGLEDLQDRLVGEQIEHGADDAEADDLRQEVRPVDAERAGDLLDLAAAFGRGLQG